MGKKSKANKKKGGGGRSRKGSGSMSPKPKGSNGNPNNNGNNENQYHQEPEVTNLNQDENNDKPTNMIQDEEAVAAPEAAVAGGDVPPPETAPETKQGSEEVMEVKQEEGIEGGKDAEEGEENDAAEQAERPTMARKNASIYTSARAVMDDNEMKEVEDAAAANSSSPEQQQQQQQHTENNARQSVYYDAAEGVDGIPKDSEKEEGEDNDSSAALLDEVSNGNSQPELDGDDGAVVAGGDDDVDLEDDEDVDPDAPARFEDLESAYSWFADHAEGPPTGPEESSEVEIVFSSKSSTDDTTTDDAATTSENNNNNNNNSNGEEEKKDEILDEAAQPLLKERRNSLIGRVKTVNADGDTADEEDNDDEEEVEDEDPWVIPDSNLRNPNRRICVVTTAALPWRTGTAVNPLLRALYLTRGRPKHYVTLVIPWCQEEEDRNKTLGNQHSFSNQAEQEEWIRDFCRTRANCKEEEKNLKIMFYSSNYNESMGSIFPSVDICALIPDNEADVAILEEPEHLNWLRVPTPYLESDEEKEKEKKVQVQKQQKTISKGRLTKRRHATAKEKQELGWRFKFRHVVGIIHTNYKAYAEQYGIGAKFITAPALCALNALVVRAYCHKVILLSGTLPSLTPYKEITCNVHGVRGEFLERPTGTTTAAEDHHEEEEGQAAPVYFIGKLIWAKGFDKILDLENLYRDKHEDYFPIDVYGAGGDEKAIKRAFYGRIPQIQQRDSSESDEGNSSASEQETAEVFTWETSLRSHLVEQSPFKDSERHASLDEHMARRRSILDPDNDDDKDVGKNDIKEPPETPKKRGNIIEELAENVVPLSVLGNLSVSALDTTKATGGAAVEFVKNVVGAGLNVAFTNDVGSPKRKSKKKVVDGSGSPQKAPKQKLIFEPPQSVFEFRRNPIQARFLGTKDHVLLRDMKEHKVFLNMSITEVLCTTSAEALAMGKFAIVPKHPSNTFFYQFPNCLAYTSLEDCLEKLEWALANDPVPLSEESAQKLSWEGANERLFDSAAVTRDEWEEWEETGKLKSDTDAARFHIETGMTGQLIGKFFTGDK